MADISLTASMRTTLLSLQNTQSLMDMTQERLSTGKKVNSAIDNPMSYYTARGLTNRASDLEALLDSMGQGIQTLKAANEGIEAITSFVQQAKAVANTARDTVSKSSLTSSGTFKNSIPEAPTGGPANTSKITINIGDDSISYDVKGAINGGAAADDIDAVITGLNADPNDDVLTKYNLELVKSADGKSIELKIKDPNVDVSSLKVSMTTEGASIGLSIGGVIDNTARDNSMKQFNEILNQIDQLANDATYKGVNLLKEDDLRVVFNEDRTSFLDVKGDNASTAGLGLSVVSDWSTTDLIDTTITEVENAINKLRDMASVFGNNYSIVQNREDFTDSLVNVLTEGSDKLVLADMNEESANMLALQTRQQLGVNALSLASQAAQSVLKLF